MRGVSVKVRKYKWKMRKKHDVKRGAKDEK